MIVADPVEVRVVLASVIVVVNPEVVVKVSIVVLVMELESVEDVPEEEASSDDKSNTELACMAMLVASAFTEAAALVS